ncbi:c-type cytochrome [SAR92 clade bacterium H921]|nr:c-type cytochrome [SAR92 clade bacterium H921]MDG0971680.1 c-type cytochrome [Porticoccaceae bacterium]MDG1308516.1 c-type cytochrome [Porticoccaceae bacterium]
MKQTFGLITIACALLIGCGGQDGSVELTATQEQQVAERIAPVGHVVMAGQVVTAMVSAGGTGRSGSDIYGTNCMACHTSGIAGAPMMGDAVAWAERLEQGIETVYANAINGIRGMPMRGTCMDCSDDEVIAAIDHILDNSQ